MPFRCAHVHFDAASRDAARALRETIEKELAGRMDPVRFHEKPPVPHPNLGFGPTVRTMWL